MFMRHQLLLLVLLLLLAQDCHATIDYAPDELAGKWSKLGALLCAWKGTVFPNILKGPMFWAIVMCHVVFVILDRLLIAAGDISKFDSKTMGIVYIDGDPANGVSYTSFFELFGYEYADAKSIIFTLMPISVSKFAIPLVFFFTVFYNANCYTRYYTLYGHCVGMGGQIMEWTAIAKSNCPDDPIAQWNSVRYILASQQMLYYMLADDDGQLDPEVWKLLTDRHLLTEEEAQTLHAYKGFKPFLAVYWALTESKYQLGLRAKDVPGAEDPSAPPSPPPSPPEKESAESHSKLKKKYHAGSLESLVQSLERVAGGGDPATAQGGEEEGDDFATALRGELVLSQLRDAAFAFRGRCGQIVNTLKQPVPYPYFHLLNLILFVNLVLFGFSAVIMAWWPFTILAVSIVTIILLGMRVLAVQLSDPFGDDAVDFEIEQFLKGAYVNSVAHLQQAKLPGFGYEAPPGVDCPVDTPCTDGPGFDYHHPTDGIKKVKPADKTWLAKPAELGPSTYGFSKL